MVKILADFRKRFQGNVLVTGYKPLPTTVTSVPHLRRKIKDLHFIYIIIYLHYYLLTFIIIIYLHYYLIHFTCQVHVLISVPASIKIGLQRISFS